MADFKGYIVFVVIVCGRFCFGYRDAPCQREKGYILHTVFTRLYKINRCCKSVSCSPGYQINICEQDFGEDTCEQCEPGYAQPDNITSALPVLCNFIECVEESILTPAGCICDTKRNYYGFNPLLCKYKECPAGYKLLQDGSCVTPYLATKIPLHIPLAHGKTTKIPRKKKTTKMEMLRPISTTTMMSTKMHAPNTERPGTTKGTVDNLSDSTIPLNVICALLGCLLVTAIVIGTVYCWKQKTLCFAQHTVESGLLMGTKTDTESIEKEPMMDLEWGPTLSLEDRWRIQALYKKSTKATIYGCLPTKYEAGFSVGLFQDIHGNRYATGFVVGEKYILGNYHTIITVAAYLSIPLNDILNNLQFEINNIVFEIENIMYWSNSLDFSVLKLKAQDGVPFPPSIHTFDDLRPDDHFDFIGYPGCREKEIDQECSLKQGIDSSKLTAELGSLMLERGLNLRNFSPPYPDISEQNYYYFDSAFEHGSSGSPGLVFRTYMDRKCGALFIGCYPVFLHDANFPNDLRANLEAKYVFEYGLKMSTIFITLKQNSPHLCSEIFPPGSYPPSWDRLGCPGLGYM